jgi:hypothetical protein
MEYFFLYIFILLSFIILVSYYNTYRQTEGGYKEAFDANDKVYVLLGDSILRNDSYVSDGSSVEDLLREKNLNINCFAEDHSKIVDIYSQLDKLSLKLNNRNTLVFVSAGGNDILSHYVDQNQDITNTGVLKPMFTSYKTLIKSIRSRLPEAKILLLDIYYPNNLQYKQFHPIIKDWNDMVYKFANTNNYDVIRISNSLTQNTDFSFGIEPSSSGGRKIVDLITMV